MRLHHELINDFGGLHGVRDEKRLQAVCASPTQNIFGEDQYKTLHEKTAVYARNIIGDHPFLDGNKRAGITTMAVFLLRNGVKLTAESKELEDFAVQIAVEHLCIDDIAIWLEQHSTPLEP